MQPLPKEVLTRLRSDLGDAYLTQDFVLVPGHPPPLASFSVTEQRLRRVPSPPLVWRSVSLTDGGSRTLAVELALGIHGPPGALEALTALVGGFERAIPWDRVVFTQDPPLSIGETGIAWSWEGGSPFDVVAWVEANALVFLRGSGKVPLAEVAAALDAVLESLDRVVDPVVHPYYPAQGRDPTGPIDEPEQAVAPRTVGVGGRIDLDWPPGFVGRTVFAEASVGSVNRDPDEPSRWYYRAPLDARESVVVDLLSVGAGIVPKGRRVPIRIVGTPP